MFESVNKNVFEQVITDAANYSKNKMGKEFNKIYFESVKDFVKNHKIFQSQKENKSDK